VRVFLLFIANWVSYSRKFEKFNPKSGLIQNKKRKLHSHFSIRPIFLYVYTCIFKKMVVAAKEKKWVVELTRGDQEAFRNLFGEYAKRIFVFAKGYLKSNEEAEEVVQEVFMKIWNVRASINTELSFKSYLFKHCLERRPRRQAQCQLAVDVRNLRNGTEPDPPVYLHLPAERRDTLYQPCRMGIRRFL